MQTSLALVHHANQYLITDGYDNREGLAAVLGRAGGASGLTHILELHARYGVPLNLHISGTLLEAIAWHQPDFLHLVRDLLQAGLIELVGSCYGQNIMRFFGPEYNRRQLDEELNLYEAHLGVDPVRVQAFWPPERVWETKRMAPALRDARLRNNGYRYVILDDRLLLSPKDPELPRAEYDSRQVWTADLYQMHEVEDGLGLMIFPIATRLRRSIPPRSDEDWVQVRGELEALLVHATEAGVDNLLAVYADDMEKVAGIGEWGGEGPEHYRNFLEWLSTNRWIKPVSVNEWAAQSPPAGKRKIATGTFDELANQFDAGEGYERWFLAPDWAPYRAYFSQAEARVKELAPEADEALIALAEKQLLVSNWETAWHTPAAGPHGDPDVHGHASPWARALTSHSRHAAVTAEAAWWMRHKDGQCHIDLLDIDNDGEAEIVLKNDSLVAVITPRWGARVVALFSIGGERGAMVVGNPCDDWNWMEELNKYMETPRNHPGCFADRGFENDAYQVVNARVIEGNACAELINVEPGSAAAGLSKTYVLELGSARLTVKYKLPSGVRSLGVECGLSPDYLDLLRGGSLALRPVEFEHARGFANGAVTAFVEKAAGGEIAWTSPLQERFGHGCMLAVEACSEAFELRVGVLQGGRPEDMAEAHEAQAEPVR